MTERISIFGLGKLGAVLAAVTASRGFDVIGMDLDERVVGEVNAGRPPVTETGLAALMRDAHFRLRATTRVADAVDSSDIAFIIVPTPSRNAGGFDVSYVLDVVSGIGAALRDDERDWFTVVVCSTVMPGSTAGEIRATLEASSGRTVGHDLGLCYSPEFIALGSVIHDMTHPDLVLLGADDARSRADLRSVLEKLVDTDPAWHELSIVDAEIAKIAINTYVTMKISYANTLAEICERIPGADAELVAAAVGADSRIGPKYLNPGGAFGGPCFPRDNAAFGSLASSVGLSAPLAAATDEVNLRQAERLADDLKHLDRVSVLGLSYKPQTNITERSFALDLCELLQHAGVVVTAYDPVVRSPAVPTLGFVVPSAEEAIQASDHVVVATAWPEFASLDFYGKQVVDVWGIVPAGPNVKRIGKS